MYLCRFLPLLLLSFPALGLAAPPPYSVTDLGTLGGESSAANAINDKGQVVGWADTSAAGEQPAIHAFLWDHGKMQDLDTLPARLESSGTEARSINNLREAAGGTAPRMGLFWAHGWLWDKSGQQIIKDAADALAVNDAGQVLVTSGLNSFIWQNGAVQEVLSIPGYHFITANSMNSHGDIAGCCWNEPSAWKAFVRLQGKTTFLGILPGMNASRALALNDRGQVAGVSSDEFYSEKTNAAGAKTTTSGTRQSRAFFWQDGRLTDLGEREVSSIGAQGQVLGSYFDYGPGRKTVTLRAFVWQNGRFTDLDTLVDPASGWKLQDARAVNKQGQIVGLGEHHGEQHAFLLTPTKESVRR